MCVALSCRKKIDSFKSQVDAQSPKYNNKYVCEYSLENENV